MPHSGPPPAPPGPSPKVYRPTPAAGSIYLQRSLLQTAHRLRPSHQETSITGSWWGGHGGPRRAGKKPAGPNKEAKKGPGPLWTIQGITESKGWFRNKPADPPAAHCGRVLTVCEEPRLLAGETPPHPASAGFPGGAILPILMRPCSPGGPAQGQRWLRGSAPENTMTEFSLQ